LWAWATRFTDSDNAGSGWKSYIEYEKAQKEIAQRDKLECYSCLAEYPGSGRDNLKGERKMQIKVRIMRDGGDFWTEDWSDVLHLHNKIEETLEKYKDISSIVDLMSNGSDDPKGPFYDKRDY